MSSPLTPEDIETIKGRQQATWSSGDYAVIGTTLQIVGESLCEAVDVTAGSRVLDVAAGNGNASLAAARRGCAVTATDYVEEFLGGAQRRASARRMTAAVRRHSGCRAGDRTVQVGLSARRRGIARCPRVTAATTNRLALR